MMRVYFRSIMAFSISFQPTKFACSARFASSTEGGDACKNARALIRESNNEKIEILVRGEKRKERKEARSSCLL